MTESLKPVVTRAGEDIRTGQSGGAMRIFGVSPQHTPATKIWYGKVSNEPGCRSLPHHHGEAETGADVMKGKGRIYFGEDDAEVIDIEGGRPSRWPAAKCDPLRVVRRLPLPRACTMRSTEVEPSMSFRAPLRGPGMTWRASNLLNAIEQALGEPWHDS